MWQNHKSVTLIGLKSLHTPSQGGSWESMVKLFKDAFNRVLDQSRRMPSLIEIPTFTSDAVRIVNDRPLISLSDKLNDLAVITPSSFLGQGLAPNTPLSAFHDRRDLRRGFLYNTTLAHKFWLCWMQGYLPTLLVETSGELLGIISPLANWSWLEMLRTSQGAGLIAWTV